MGAGRSLVSCAVLAAVAFAQEADRPEWVKDNYVGWPSPELMRSPGRTLRWVGLWGSRRLRHGSLVDAVAVGPNGAWIVSGCHDGRVTIWDTQTGKEIRTFGSHAYGTYAVVLSPDGRRIFSGGQDGMVNVWRVATGEKALSWRATQEEPVGSMALSPDGRTLVASGSRRLIVWDAEKGSLVHLLSDDLMNSGRIVAFAQNGKSLVAIDGNNVRVWDTNTWARLRTFSGPEENRGSAPPWFVNLAAWGDELVAAHSSGTILRWDIRTGKRLPALEATGQLVEALAFCADGKLLACGDACGELLLWERPVYTLRWRIAASDSDLGRAVAFFPDARSVLTGGQDGALRVWDAGTGEQRGGSEWGLAEVSTLSISADGTWAVLGRETLPAAWVLDTATGTVRREVAQAVPAWSSGIMPDGQRVVTAGRDGEVVVWDRVSGEVLHRLRGHEDGVTTITASSDGTVAVSASLDRSVRVWDVVTGHCRGVLRPGCVRALDIDSSGKTLATGDVDGVLRLWDLATGAGLRTVAARDDRCDDIVAVRFSPSGKEVAAATEHGVVRITALDRAGAPPREIEAHLYDRLVGLTWGEDGRFLFTAGGDGFLKVWEARSGLLVDVIPVDGEPTRLATHDARIYVGCRNSTVCVYEYTPPQNGRRDSESDK